MSAFFLISWLGFEMGDWYLPKSSSNPDGLPKKQSSPSWPTKQFRRQQNPLLKCMKELAKLKVKKILF